MGGAISVFIASLAAAAFLVNGNLAVGILSIVIAVICLWSSCHMNYFARMLARNRLFVEALSQGRIETGTPEAEQYWKKMPITIEIRDIQDVPNWIACFNMLATMFALALLIWAGIATIV